MVFLIRDKGNEEYMSHWNREIFKECKVNKA